MGGGGGSGDTAQPELFCPPVPGSEGPQCAHLTDYAGSSSCLICDCPARAPKCRIEVFCHPAGSVGEYRLPSFHCWIQTTDCDGSTQSFDLQPTRPNPEKTPKDVAKIPDEDGGMVYKNSKLRVVKDEKGRFHYDGGVFDPNDPITIHYCHEEPCPCEQGDYDTACECVKEFVESGSYKWNDASKYVATGPNSNTFVDRALRFCGIELVFPLKAEGATYQDGSVSDYMERGMRRWGPYTPKPGTGGANPAKRGQVDNCL